MKALPQRQCFLFTSKLLQNMQQNIRQCLKTSLSCHLATLVNISNADKGQGLFVWSDLIKSHCYGQYTLVLIFLIKRSFWFSFNSRSMACVPISPLARMSVCNSPACSTNRKLRLANPALSLVELSHSHSQLSWSFSQVSGANAPIPAYPAVTDYTQQSCADFRVYLSWFFNVFV